MTNETVIVNLPFFPGFYNSNLSATVDSAEEREAEYSAEKEESREYYPETYQPEELRLDASDYASILFDCMDYSAAHNAMARDYVESFDRWAADNLGTAAGSFTFESMDSPREYNFRTDRVYATVPQSTMESLYRGLDRTKLAEMIEERHSSYDGFHSFYSNDVDAWPEDVADMDHNELGTVLCAAIAMTGEAESMASDIEYPIYESDYEYIDQHCNWSKFEEKAREMRAAKLAEWIKSDAIAARAYVNGASEVAELLPLALAELDSDEAAEWDAVAATTSYRCPFTLDLFNRGPETRA